MLNLGHYAPLLGHCVPLFSVLIQLSLRPYSLPHIVIIYIPIQKESSFISFPFFDSLKVVNYFLELSHLKVRVRQRTTGRRQ